MTSRAGGSAEMLPIYRKYWPLIRHSHWMTIGPAAAPIEIYRVRGQYIRGWIAPDGEYVKIWQDFTEGGNSEAYPWMERNQIIIEATLLPGEQRATLIHEMRELIGMAFENLGYERAHTNDANKAEEDFRRNPGKWLQIWGSLQQRYASHLAERHGHADRMGEHPSGRTANHTT